MHKYYVYYNINKNNNIEISTIPKNFFNLTDIKIDLSNKQIYKIRAKIVDEYKGLTLTELVEKIKSEIPKLYFNINDIKYKINIINKLIDREQRLLFLGLNNNLELINSTNTNEFFIDITFKIIPVKFRPYKLFLMKGITNKGKNQKF